MSDLVERLRTAQFNGGHEYADLGGKAADEIERLRRAVAKMAAAAGPAYTPRWILDEPWFQDGSS